MASGDPEIMFNLPPVQESESTSVWRAQSQKKSSRVEDRSPSMLFGRSEEKLEQTSAGPPPDPSASPSAGPPPTPPPALRRPSAGPPPTLRRPSADPPPDLRWWPSADPPPDLRRTSADPPHDGPPHDNKIKSGWTRVESTQDGKEEHLHKTRKVKEKTTDSGYGKSTCEQQMREDPVYKGVLEMLSEPSKLPPNKREMKASTPAAGARPKAKYWASEPDEKPPSQEDTEESIRKEIRKVFSSIWLPQQETPRRDPPKREPEEVIQTPRRPIRGDSIETPPPSEESSSPPSEPDDDVWHRRRLRTPDGGRYGRRNNDGQKKLKPDKYDGTTDWSDYKRHFEIVAQINGWSQREKGLYLAGSLSGKARGILSDLSTEQCTQWDLLIDKIEARYQPKCQVTALRTQLENKRRSFKQDPIEFAQEVSRLTARAYKDMNEEARDMIALQAFKRGLPDGGLKTLLEVMDPKSIEEASALVMKYEGANKRPYINKPGVLTVDEDSSEDEWDQLVMSLDPKAAGKKQATEKSTKFSNLTGQKGKNSDNGGKKSGSLWEVVQGQGKKIDTLVELMTQLVLRQKSWPRNASNSVNGGRAGQDKPYGVCWKCLEPGHFAKECGKQGNKLVSLVQRFVEETGELGMVAPDPEDDEGEEHKEEQEN